MRETRGFEERMIKRIEKCRVSGSTNLVSVLSLGNQALTGVFPATASEPVTIGPLELVWCPESGLLQLAHSYAADEMYGENYGYRSGLNQSMVRHLTQKIHNLEKDGGSFRRRYGARHWLERCDVAKSLYARYR